VIRYRRLARASVAKKCDRLEQLIAAQLAEIGRLNAEIDELKGKPKARRPLGLNETLSALTAEERLAPLKEVERSAKRP
jgi:hypothetical protein